MAGLYHPTRGGTRGGKDQFKWDDIKSDKDREFYLGHSLMAPVGKWQEGKDLIWYARDKKEGLTEAQERRRKEIAQMKEIESMAMAAALGRPASNGDATALTSKEIEEILARKDADASKKRKDKKQKRAKKEKRAKKREISLDDFDSARGRHGSKNESPEDREGSGRREGREAIKEGKKSRAASSHHHAAHSSFSPRDGTHEGEEADSERNLPKRGHSGLSSGHRQGRECPRGNSSPPDIKRHKKDLSSERRHARDHRRSLERDDEIDVPRHQGTDALSSYSKSKYTREGDSARSRKRKSSADAPERIRAERLR